MTIYEHKFSSRGMDMLLHYIDERYAMLMQATHGGTITRIEI
ncbi:gp71 [Escherichia phage phiEB49]|uniref:Gp71 n=1 Tax=Escherichia phage phiEB49 TaxID=1048207 RepID=F8UBY1_9CAUD|nr:gp71 [Escherichia phage phiEB49]AEI91271.1 gp71 [Escherichia phage phiEB49]